MPTLILKATERCNSNCRYCDVVRKKAAADVMPVSVLETVFRRVDEYLRANAGQRLELLWHGGEPLLLGAEYFREAKSLQDRFCPETAVRITHSIQSNLTLFTDELVEPMRALGIAAFGTSYDPEPNMRGAGASIDTERYNRAFLRALRLLEQHGFGWGMIYVVTRRSLERPLDVFMQLTNLQLSGGVNMNPVLIYDDDRKDVAITPGEYVDFLGAIFPTWWRHRQRWPGVQPFRSLEENIVGGRVSLGCVDSGRCAYEEVNVAPDGATSQCGRSADWGLLSYGNLADVELEAVFRDPQRDALRRRVEALREGECGDCRFWDLCHGGCPLDAWSKHRAFDHKTEWCEARRGFIERHFEPVTGVRWAGRTRRAEP